MNHRPDRPRPRASAGTTLDCLGVAIAVSPGLADLCRHLPRTTARPVVRTDAVGDAGVAALTALAVERTELLTVHAAVVVGRDGAVVVPAPSGAGKSTLCAALVRRGFAYLSDEVLAVDRATGEVVGFPRPLALHAASWDVVDLPGPRPPAGSERAVDPATLGRVWTGPTRVAQVVIPHRGDHAVSLVPAGPGEVVAALVPRCFNHYRDTRGSLDALGRIATGAWSWFATYRDAPSLADTLAEAVGPDSPPGESHVLR